MGSLLVCGGDHLRVMNLEAIMAASKSIGADGVSPKR